MDKKDMFETIRIAAEEADKKKNEMNKVLAREEKEMKFKNKKNEESTEEEEEEWSEYEATYKAMLYHELITQGIDFKRISLENGTIAEDVDKKKHENRHVG
jgi:beta-xylosidase